MYCSFDSMTERMHNTVMLESHLRSPIDYVRVCVRVAFACACESALLKHTHTNTQEEQFVRGKVSNTVICIIHKGNPEKRFKNGVSLVSMYFDLNETNLFIFFLFVPNFRCVSEIFIYINGVA